MKKALVALALVNVALGAALVWKTLERKPVVVVPWAKSQVEALPGQVPDTAAREFALRYVLLFDNFTPATIDESTEMLKSLIAPRFWTEATEALEKRKAVVHEGRMSAQAILERGPSEIERFEDGTVEVRFYALRRTFIADKLSSQVRARYVVALEPAPPTELNPYGLLVIGQAIHENP